MYRSSVMWLNSHTFCLVFRFLLTNNLQAPLTRRLPATSQACSVRPRTCCLTARAQQQRQQQQQWKQQQQSWQVSETRLVEGALMGLGLMRELINRALQGSARG